MKVCWKPNEGAQCAFLRSTAREILYGGAAGGGKTASLLAGSLRWITNPNYRGIILRRTRPDLQHLIDESKKLIGEAVPGATYIEARNRWEFPSGAILQMGHAEHEKDIEDYLSFEYSYIAFDELTTFTERMYRFMLSRNRTSDPGLPLFIRSATNPTGEGMEWVYRRFVAGREPYIVYDEEVTIPDGEGGEKVVPMTRQYIPATVFDNPMLANRDEYIAGLKAMGGDLAEAQLYGLWSRFTGQMFPFDVPETEPRIKHPDHYVIRALDYGWTAPTVVYYLIVYTTPDVEYPLEVACELAGARVTVASWAHLMRETEQRLSVTPRMSVIDPSVKNKRSAQLSILEQFQRENVWFTEADNDRVSGWARLRTILERGQLAVWRGKAPHLIRTLPLLTRDKTKSEDVSRSNEDHYADALRYGVMAWPGYRAEPPAERPKIDRNRDQVYDRVIRTLNQPAPQFLDLW